MADGMDNHAALVTVLDGLRASTRTQRDKGTAFERLVRTYLQKDALWGEKFSDVWLWSDWPGRNGRGDAGIDLVARDGQTGELWALQAKFYDPDHRLEKADIDSFFTESGKAPFAQRMLVSTTDHWSSKAEQALEGQQIPVTRLRLLDLADSTVDWSTYTADQPGAVQHFQARTLRPHQQQALKDVTSGFASHERGKLIMACGTGKTFTALRIAEQLAGAGGRVLFLVPSISLLQQTLREWINHAQLPLRCFAVCSDTKVGKNREDLSVHDLQYPATTNAGKLAVHATPAADGKLTVVFSTYQSIQVIAEAQTMGLPDFDLIVCDEAHRTTGVTLADADESNFVRIHDPAYVKGTKRLYMTATPKIYSDDVKAKAAEAGAAAASMDNQEVFGPEFHRLGFGEAVAKDLLSDYKVLVLAVDESFVAKAFQQQLADANHELNLDDAAKIIGCWNGLAKRQSMRVGDDGTPAPLDTDDSAAMQRAVAFSRSIKDSKRLAALFEEIVADYTAASDDDDLLAIEADHVDGAFNVLDRNAKLDWLKHAPPVNTCRILSNARCLSEGVDVPALDAVLFLNPRNSTVDVVQSVGRVMRKHDTKKYGYVILPIGIPAGMTPEQALADHQRYKVVWQVLQALRAHDDRFNAMVNKIELNANATDKVQVIGVGGDDNDEDGDGPGQPTMVQGTLNFPQLEAWREAILAKLVEKVGDRRYWEDWAKDIAVIADRHITRITAILDDPATGVQEQFDQFLTGLRGNLNDAVTRADAIEMLAQHLITKPVFDALFEGYEFAAANPVSQVMQTMLDALDEHALGRESATLEQFYESVRMRAAGIDNAAGKQRIIIELYEKFFKNAFPRMADRLGIVYTPTEVVDYILHSVNHALRTEFGSSLADGGVHILDPFTGTGTFIVRLLESGLLTPEALQHKYRHDLHANEIVLLAYYIAAINIEATYHGIHGGDYEPFNGIVLTDTFQMTEDGDPDDQLVFPINNERVEALRRLPIRVIVGNPPYSVGQGSENDSNKNLPYPTLDAHIRRTYAERSSGTLMTSLYDSYVRAFRWASDRVGDQGVIGFVTNGGWIDNNAMDGFRKTLEIDFSAIWVFNLRGNQRTSGELSRQEGGKIFGSGSRAPVAITILVKKPGHSGPATIHYQDIGDYLTREEKLQVVADQVSTSDGKWERITPNGAGDWINQRDDTFTTYSPLGDKKDPQASPLFALYSMGVKTNRDAWAINSSRTALSENMRRMIDYYDLRVQLFPDFCRDRGLARNEETVKGYVGLHSDPTKISWTRELIADLRKGKTGHFHDDRIVSTMYRPFFKQWLYFDRQFNNTVYQIPRFFPSPETDNIVISVNAGDRTRPFGPVICDVIPQLTIHGAGSPGQGFPLWVYEKADDDHALFATEDPIAGYTRRHAVTDATLERYQARHGDKVSKEDIFYHVYGLLHSPQYVERYRDSLSKMIPRIPMVEDFWGFAQAGRQLATWHLNYETVDPWPVTGLPGPEASVTELRVEKMRIPKNTSGRIIVNSEITLDDIPDEAWQYTVNGKSALHWLVDRYQVKVDKASQILNDPNTYSDDPRYIVDLVARMVRVSVESVEIIGGLPNLELMG